MPLTATLPLYIRHLGLTNYSEVWRQMATFTNNRQHHSDDELWLLQHRRVFTFGQAAKPEHLLNAHDVPVVQSDRGGQVTYHGPGQLIAYPLINLRRLRLGVREFVTGLEQVLIDTLADYHIQGERREKAPGVYVNGAKIAALGLRVRHGYTFHGMSLNVAMDLTPFAWINPCGYQDLAVTQMADCLDLGRVPTLDRVGDNLSRHFCRYFGLTSSRPEQEFPVGTHGGMDAPQINHLSD